MVEVTSNKDKKETKRKQSEREEKNFRVRYLWRTLPNTLWKMWQKAAEFHVQYTSKMSFEHLSLFFWSSPLHFKQMGQQLIYSRSSILRSRMSAMPPKNPGLLTLVWDKSYSLLCSQSWSERWLGQPWNEPLHSLAYWPRQITRCVFVLLLFNRPECGDSWEETKWVSSTKTFLSLYHLYRNCPGVYFQTLSYYSVRRTPQIRQIKLMFLEVLKTEFF